MIEFRIKWTQCPTSRNTQQVIFVEASTEADAKAIAKDHIERKYGIAFSWFVIDSVSVVEPLPAGKVIE